jgi:hypothetical protein
MLTFRMLNPAMTEAHLGIIPMFCHDDDPRPAREQIDENYQHGGGWSPMRGFTLKDALSALDKRSPPYLMAKHLELHYPEDEPFKPLAVAAFRDETIVFYQYSVVAIFQPDYSFEVGRLD